MARQILGALTMFGAQPSLLFADAAQGNPCRAGYVLRFLIIRLLWISNLRVRSVGLCLPLVYCDNSLLAQSYKLFFPATSEPENPGHADSLVAVCAVMLGSFVALEVRLAI